MVKLGILKKASEQKKAEETSIFEPSKDLVVVARNRLNTRIETS
jgi:hypothetical protein